jgi:hypothetical protein
MKRALVLIAASAVVYVIAAWWSATQLPENGVAMQVNAAGEVNRYSTRSGAIGTFVGLGGFLLVLGVVVVCLCGLLPIRFLNIPKKDYWTTPERAPIVRQMIVWDMAVIVSMPLLALSFIPINVALMSEDPSVSALWIIVPIGVWLIAMVGYTIWMVVRRYRPPANSEGSV